MAGMATCGWKWLDMTRNSWKQLKLLKWLIWLEMSGTEINGMTFFYFSPYVSFKILNLEEEEKIKRDKRLFEIVTKKGCMIAWRGNRGL